MNIFTRSVIQSLAFFMVAILSAVLVFYLGPDVESALFPVVKSARVVVIPSDPKQPPDGIRVLLHSIKQRESCELVNRLISVRVTDTEWVRAIAFFKDEGTGELVQLGKTRPVGDVVVDEVQIRPKGLGLHIVLVHRCHPFWLSTTDEIYMPTFPIQPAQR